MSACWPPTLACFHPLTELRSESERFGILCGCEFEEDVVPAVHQLQLVALVRAVLKNLHTEENRTQ